MDCREATTEAHLALLGELLHEHFRGTASIIVQSPIQANRRCTDETSGIRLPSDHQPVRYRNDDYTMPRSSPLRRPTSTARP